MKVYIADPSAFIRARIIMMLTTLRGVSIVGQTADTNVAKIAIPRLKPDIAILDVKLRGEKGIDLLASIKHDGFIPIIIILTNYSTQQYRERILRAGADYFLDKSMEFDRIIDIVQQYTWQTTVLPETDKNVTRQR